LNDYCNCYKFHFYIFKILTFKTFQWGGVIPTSPCWAYFLVLCLPGGGTPGTKP